ncbi:hypothetical protein [Vibrio atlanticus]|uniref:hypothetical protein n=1 Tax=Vibrio atlanticus TaxID=693153 RepID=UPI00354CD6A1
MSFIIPPPVKIQNPELFMLSNSIGGSRTDVAASELAVKLLSEKVFELADSVAANALPRLQAIAKEVEKQTL